MSEQSKVIEELQDKATRDAFVSSQISIPIAFQISALRQQRGWTQKQLAEKAGMLQPRINTLERPSGSEPNLRTLKRLASAFDVALIVRFASFSEVLKWAEEFSPDTFEVPSFDKDPGFHREEVAEASSVAVHTNTIIESALTSRSETAIQLSGSVLSCLGDRQQESRDSAERRHFGSLAIDNIISHADFLEARRKRLAAEMAFPSGQHDGRLNLPERMQTAEQRVVGNLVV